VYCMTSRAGGHEAGEVEAAPIQHAVLTRWQILGNITALGIVCEHKRRVRKLLKIFQGRTLVVSQNKKFVQVKMYIYSWEKPRTTNFP
jgi:hypothetical protein